MVVLRQGEDAPADLLGFLDGKLARYKIPTSVVFTGALQRKRHGQGAQGTVQAAARRSLNALPSALLPSFLAHTWPIPGDS